MTDRQKPEKLRDAQKMLSVWIAERTHRAFKSKTAKEGRTINATVESLVKLYLEGQTKL